MRKIQESEVVFSLTVEQDDLEVRGNAMASGDDEADRKYEDEIIRRLDNGDVWAWAAVTVHATITLPDGSTMTGDDHLGGCCYADEADFTQSGGYYDDMRHEALADLQRKIESEIARGAQLAEWFKESVTLKCDGWCDPKSETITHIDEKGFIYCASCGPRRRESGRRCRKLTAAELKRILNGQQITKY